jgi:hypothetical protein
MLIKTKYFAVESIIDDSSLIDGEDETAPRENRIARETIEKAVLTEFAVSC